MVTDDQIDEYEAETWKHIRHVVDNITHFVTALRERGFDHDRSKFERDEMIPFIEIGVKLKDVQYGSQEYSDALDELKDTALARHYARNSHHPEHYYDGIDGMTLFDIVEMFCDWKAATLRHKDGDMLHSIDVNRERFDISPQLENIFINTELRWDEK